MSTLRTDHQKLFVHIVLIMSIQIKAISMLHWWCIKVNKTKQKIFMNWTCCLVNVILTHIQNAHMNTFTLHIYIQIQMYAWQISHSCSGCEKSHFEIIFLRYLMHIYLCVKFPFWVLTLILWLFLSFSV